MNENITLYHGDCLEVLRTLPASSVDAVVTDPPAGIGFMGKEWDHSRGGRKGWSEWLSDRLQECLRVAKPGAHLLCWALPRTSHWTACALEDAGWIIEDRIAHIFGTGFPKHKSKLKPAVEDWWLTTKPGGVKWLGVDACRVEGVPPSVPQFKFGVNQDAVYGMKTGVGRNGKMSEPHLAGRWPANLVLSHHPECKPNGTKKVKVAWSQPVVGDQSGTCVYASGNGLPNHNLGKPAGYADLNGIETVQAFDCHPECPVRILDEQSGELKTGGRPGSQTTIRPFKSVAKGKEPERIFSSPHFGSSGGASRFFPGFLYCPKANRNDRGEGNIHPTVKAEPLMRWLCKLVTPPGGTVLDPFAGSGSTGFAAEAEGFQSILIEQNPEYVKIIEDRMNAIQEQTPLFK